MPSSPLHRVGAALLAATLLTVPVLAGCAPTAAPLPDAVSAAGARPVAALADARLPERVDAPGAWSEAEHESGPVAAVGIALRTRPVGLVDRAERLSLFAVSATDGRARWLRLPGSSLDAWDLVSGVALSPDGRWLGWVRPTRLRSASGAPPGGSLRGWSVM